MCFERLLGRTNRSIRRSGLLRMDCCRDAQDQITIGSPSHDRPFTRHDGWPGIGHTQTLRYGPQHQRMGKHRRTVLCPGQRRPPVVGGDWSFNLIGFEDLVGEWFAIGWPAVGKLPEPASAKWSPSTMLPRDVVVNVIMTIPSASGMLLVCGIRIIRLGLLTYCRSTFSRALPLASSSTSLSKERTCLVRGVVMSWIL